MDRRSLFLLVLAGLLAVLAGSTWPGFPSPNEYARTFAARAMVERGTWEISHELNTYGFLEDRARVDDRYYSNKPPGLIWLAVPAVRVMAAVAPDRHPMVDNYAARLLLSTLPALLCAALLGLWLRARERSAAAGIGLLLFGTFWGLSAAFFWSFAFTGGLVFACAWLLYAQERLPERAAMLLAGFLGALCAVSEYSSAIVLTALFAPAMLVRLRRIIPVALGMAAPLLMLAMYNLACFGTALTLSNRYDDAAGYAELGQSAAFGMGLPTAGGMFGLLLSPLLGLFFFSPFLLPALAAPVVLWRRGERAFAAAVAGCVWLHPLVMAGYANWHGGASLGPRYLGLVLPMFVFATLLVPLGRWRGLFWGAATASLLVHAALRIVPPFAIDDVATASTIKGWVLPALREGLVNGLYLSTGGLLVASAALFALVHLGAVSWLVATERRDANVRWLAGAAAVVLAVQLGVGQVTVRQVTWAWAAMHKWPQERGWEKPVPPVPRAFGERYLGELPGAPPAGASPE
ncbi:MAG: hypothetical protein KDA24_10460 [Deltaproteobacteria bacterium]|nr:hypothetical protein [Deltaproteobacteria bacterium]